MKINMERSHNFPCISGEPLLDPGQIQGSGSDMNPEAQKELRGIIHFFLKPSIMFVKALQEPCHKGHADYAVRRRCSLFLNTFLELFVRTLIPF